MLRRSFILWTLAGLILVVIVWAAGCRRSPDALDPASPGRDGAGPRIVTLAPALGVMCRDLGLERSIVGRHAWDMALDPSIPTVGTHDDPDLEAMLRVRPTHILVQDMASRVPASLTRMAAERGWTILAFPLLTLDDIARAMDGLQARLAPPPADAGSGGAPSGHTSSGGNAEKPSARLARAWSDRGEPARAAGRVLLLGGVDPPGAMGPGSFHHQLIERLGATPALTTGGPWQELDHEDILRLAPDSILLFQPRDIDDPAGSAPTAAESLAALGGLAELDIPAVRAGRVAVIDHPLGLLPASSLAGVAGEIARVFEWWGEGG